MNHNPVSVIIPAYNRADRLPSSVNSVLQQTHQELEVIVIDDGSSDNTEQVLSSINDDRLHYHRLQINHGAAHARNIGVSLARYDSIAFNDSDDMWHPEKLEQQLSYWSDHPEDILVYCAYKADLPNGEYVSFPSEEQGTPDTLSGNIFYYLLYRPSIGTPTILTTKKVFLASGGFDPAYPALEDWDFSIKAARLGNVGYVNRILVTVDFFSDNRISESKLNFYKARCMILNNYKEEIKAIDLFDLYADSLMDKAIEEGYGEVVRQFLQIDS